jgi:putative hemolysin
MEHFSLRSGPRQTLAQPPYRAHRSVGCPSMVTGGVDRRSDWTQRPITRTDPKIEEIRVAGTVVTEILVILVLILANAVFAAAEIAIVSVRRSRLEELSRSGKQSARAVLSLKDDPERFLATVQVGMTVVSATAAAFGGASVAVQIAGWLENVPWIGPYARDVSLAVLVVSFSYLSIVLGELVPKSLALRSAEKYALWVGRPLLSLAWIARPIVSLLTASSNLLLRPFRDQTSFTETRPSAEELQDLVDQAAKAGTVNPELGEIASRALDLQGLKASDVMIPRQDVVLLPRHAGLEEVQRILLEHTHTRLPVFEDDVDNIVGYINVKDILCVAWDPKLFILEDLLRPAYFVPESLDLLDLLNQMRDRHVPFAIVVDEQGALAGIVTLEDVVEEVVGEFFSEHTRHVPELITVEPTGTAIVDGRAPVRDVNRELSLELPEGKDYSTMAGLCLVTAERIPHVGEEIVIPGRAVLEIVEASPQKVRKVRIRPPSFA